MDRAQLQKVGLKATLPRLKILELLLQNQDEHLSAEDVYQRVLAAGDDVGLATIYRVLTQFESAGLVVRHNFDGGQSVFEIDSGEHHDHILCVECGKVTEFVDARIERRQDQVAKELGFEVAEHSLVMYGRCTKRKCPNRPTAD